MLNIAVLVSGGGTNLQALIDAQRGGQIQNGVLKLVASSSDKAYALSRARQADIETLVIDSDDFDRTLCAVLDDHKIGLVVLAGFMRILGKEVIQKYRGRIINIHPALIPSFCGKGMYGLRVHEAALERGVKLTGATVHLVNEIPDGGPILLQQAVEVLESDTPEILQKRVMEEAEWKLLPKAVAMFCNGAFDRGNET